MKPRACATTITGRDVIGGAGACCSNSDCEQRDYPVCSEKGYCQKPNYRPTGPGCRKERGRVKCVIDYYAAVACPQFNNPNRGCPAPAAADGEPPTRIFSGGGTAGWLRNQLDRYDL